MNSTIRNVPAATLKPGMQLIRYETAYREVIRVLPTGIGYVEIMHGPIGHPGDLQYDYVYAQAMVPARIIHP